MIKYKAEFSYSPSIKAVEVVRETAKQVTYLSTWFGQTGESKANKQSYGVLFADSWDEAHSFLLVEAEKVVASARRSLEIANSKLGNIKGMKKPTTDEDGE